MASWNELRRYIESNYTLDGVIGDGLRMSFRLESGRTQVIVVTPARLMNGAEEWVVLESPIGDLREINCEGALRNAGDLVCGGLATAMQSNELVVVRHSLPLVNLDINEFERPLMLLVHTADQFEQAISGARDAY